MVVGVRTWKFSDLHWDLLRGHGSSLCCCFFFYAGTPGVRISFLPLRSTLLYLIASGGMSIFTWQFRQQGLWGQGPFLMQNWTVFAGLMVGSALIYLKLLLLFREEHAVKNFNTTEVRNQKQEE
ncbi:MAG: hypothetical protein CM1200mP30_29230 [Pseudomonadota bacterium]|nr:MAG: hypothetical protein CM1200mP30_29230 [Pseudomonadota bacterium]